MGFLGGRRVAQGLAVGRCDARFACVSSAQRRRSAHRLASVPLWHHTHAHTLAAMVVVRMLVRWREGGWFGARRRERESAARERQGIEGEAEGAGGFRREEGRGGGAKDNVVAAASRRAFVRARTKHHARAQPQAPQCAEPRDARTPPRHAHRRDTHTAATRTPPPHLGLEEVERRARVHKRVVGAEEQQRRPPPARERLVDARDERGERIEARHRRGDGGRRRGVVAVGAAVRERVGLLHRVGAAGHVERGAVKRRLVVGGWSVGWWWMIMAVGLLVGGGGSLVV